MGMMKQLQMERDERAMRWLCGDCLGSGILDHHDGEKSGQVTCFTCGGSGYKKKERRD